MVIQLIIDLLVILIFLYYLSFVLQLFGAKIFSVKEFKVGLALIPFYYWLKKSKKPEEPEEKELSFEEKLAAAEETVQLAKKQMQDLSSEAGTNSKDAKQKFTKAKKAYEKSLKNLELLKKTKF